MLLLLKLTSCFAVSNPLSPLYVTTWTCSCNLYTSRHDCLLFSILVGWCGQGTININYSSFKERATQLNQTWEAWISLEVRLGHSKVCCPGEGWCPVPVGATKTAHGVLFWKKKKKKREEVTDMNKTLDKNKAYHGFDIVWRTFSLKLKRYVKAKTVI